MSSPILPLKVSAAEVARRGKRLLGPVDFTLEGEGTTIVMGPNGAGKTTFLRLMHGLERPRTGGLTWSGGAREAMMRQAYVFQSPIVLRRTVLGNAMYPLTLRRVPRTEARRAAVDVLAEVGLEGHSEQPARALSGGERQKLALARALVTRPDVLFLDEPTANLDGRSTRDIEAILGRIRDGGTRLVMATHDLGQARRLATEVVFLLGGRIHETGSAQNFFSGASTREAQAFLKGDIVE